VYPKGMKQFSDRDRRLFRQNFEKILSKLKGK
jgi:uncharacterized protein YaiI (UPF0178 family)